MSAPTPEIHHPNQPDGIADDSGDYPDVARAARRVDAWIREWGDGLIDVAGQRPLYARDLAALVRAVRDELPAASDAADSRADHTRMTDGSHERPSRRRSLKARFRTKVWVDIQSGCWLWTGSKCRRGYGRIGIDTTPALAHRVAYELFVGPIPDGMQIDHLCRNRACASPDHLEPVTPRENNRRSDSLSAINARMTHCRNGHPFNEANTLVATKGERRCRACTREKNRLAWQRIKSDPELLEQRRAYDRARAPERWARTKAARLASGSVGNG